MCVNALDGPHSLAAARGSDHIKNRMWTFKPTSIQIVRGKYIYETYNIAVNTPSVLCSMTKPSS